MRNQVTGWDSVSTCSGREVNIRHSFLSLPLSGVVSSLKQAACWCFYYSLQSSTRVIARSVRLTCTSDLEPWTWPLQAPAWAPALTTPPKDWALDVVRALRDLQRSKSFLGEWHVLHKLTEMFVGALGTVRCRAGQRMCSPAFPEIKSLELREASAPPGSPGPIRPVARCALPGACVQGADGLYRTPTRAAFSESNPDDYICNLIKTGLFLEFTLKALRGEEACCFF